VLDQYRHEFSPFYSTQVHVLGTTRALTAAEVSAILGTS
jgi:hypothetical protein